MTVVCVRAYPDAAIPNGGTFGGTRMHRGVDHSQFWIDRLGLSRTFTPWEEGRVVAIRRQDVGTYGLVVEVEGAGSGLYWSYCHGKSIDAGVKVGETVRFGEPLGVIGSSGTAVAAGSEHLHTMLSRKRGAAFDSTIPVMDPLAYVRAHLSTKPAGTNGTPIESEENDTMNTTVPVTYTDSKTKKQTWARRRGLRIETTTSQGMASRWKAEIGFAGDSIKANASLYLADWAAAIAQDKSDLSAIFTGAKLDVVALAAQIAAKLDFPSVEEIADGVNDDAAERMKA